MGVVSVEYCVDPLPRASVIWPHSLHFSVSSRDFQELHCKPLLEGHRTHILLMGVLPSFCFEATLYVCSITLAIFDTIEDAAFMLSCSTGALQHTPRGPTKK